jgi:hypothetical protein
LPTFRTQGQVYLVWALGTTFWKIGFTSLPLRRRLSLLNTASPFPLLLQGARFGSYKDEKRLHQRLRQFHYRGEWFCLPESLAWRLLQYFGNEIPTAIKQDLTLPEFP